MPQTLAEYVRTHRKWIDGVIRRAGGGSPNTFDDPDGEREMWVANDETLYLEAQRKGVDV